MEFVFYVRTDISGSFNLWRTSYISVVFLFGCLKRRRLKSFLRRVFLATVKNPSRFSYPCFTVFIPNVVCKPLFKPVAINLDSSSSFNLFSSVSVDLFGCAKILATLPYSWIFSLQWVCQLEQISGVVLGQNDPRFHFIHVGPPCGDFLYWEREQGPGTSKVTTSINS